MFFSSWSWTILIINFINLMKLLRRSLLSRINILDLISKYTKILSTKILCLKKLNNLWAFWLFLLWNFCWFIRIFLNLITKIKLCISLFYKIWIYLWLFRRNYCLILFVNACWPFIRNASLSTRSSIVTLLWI